MKLNGRDLLLPLVRLVLRRVVVQLVVMVVVVVWVCSVV